MQSLNHRRWILLIAGIFAACNGTIEGDVPDASVAAEAGGTDAGISSGESGGGADDGAPPLEGGASFDGGALVDAMPDSGQRDGARDSGSCASALLCDDFEGYSPGGPPRKPWTAGINGGAVVIDSMHAHSGMQAVHITVNGASSNESAFFSVTGAPVFPQPRPEVFGRMMVWLLAAPRQVTHWTNIQGQGQVTGQSFRSITNFGGQYSPKLDANYFTNGPATDCWENSMTSMPVQRWACLEWRFYQPNNEVDFWLDGSSVVDLTVIGKSQGCVNNGLNGKWLLPMYDTIKLGWEHYQSSDRVDMWIDDVALDIQRIGCP
jgi:hypothetical protein